MMSLEEREREIEKVVRIAEADFNNARQLHAINKEDVIKNRAYKYAEVLKLQELLALNKTIKDGLNGFETSIDLIE
ncbi:hypothetical protein [Lactobacillus delbrueckii]|uniref:hypothetical protein n=1 Tax=Lactobacillus delbrueckii TaxID=1584 RepID=UPI001E55FED4|nr:hypothetical protein [Lactobacillus delbrueckii]MCD5545463.1 hypothetical protein [Lactobacillus delbrueckii subsp. lactis]